MMGWRGNHSEFLFSLVLRDKKRVRSAYIKRGDGQNSLLDRTSASPSDTILRMSLPIHVDAYSGYNANEWPILFWLDPQIRQANELTGAYEIAQIEDGWYDSNPECFKGSHCRWTLYMLLGFKDVFTVP